MSTPLLALTVETKNNGYVVRISASSKFDGEHVYKSVDILEMLEFIGLVINEREVVVREK